MDIDLNNDNQPNNDDKTKGDEIKEVKPAELNANNNEEENKAIDQNDTKVTEVKESVDVKQEIEPTGDIKKEEKEMIETKEKVQTIDEKTQHQTHPSQEVIDEKKEMIEKQPEEEEKMIETKEKVQTFDEKTQHQTLPSQVPEVTDKKTETQQEVQITVHKVDESEDVKPKTDKSDEKTETKHQHHISGLIANPVDELNRTASQLTFEKQWQERAMTSVNRNISTKITCEKIAERIEDLNIGIVRSISGFILILRCFLNFFSIIVNFMNRPTGEIDFSNSFFLARIVIVWFELLVYSGSFFFLVFYTFKLFVHTKQQNPNLSRASDKNNMTDIIRFLASFSTLSFVKYLNIPRLISHIKNFSNKATAKFMFETEEIVRKEKEAGVCCSCNIVGMFFWKIFIAFVAVFIMIAPLGMSMIGLSLKISLMDFITTNVSRWSVSNFLTFFGFVNNLVGVTDTQNERMQCCQLFLFAGRDATYQLDEVQTEKDFLLLILNWLTDQWGFRGFLFFTSLSEKDLLNLTVLEHEQEIDKSEDQKDLKETELPVIDK